MVKITDFGIAHAIGSAPITATGKVMGTPTYLAPERVAGAQAVAASDLYALGIVAYECLSGAPPFVGPALEVANAHRDRPLPPLPATVPDDVVAFVMQLTAKDPRWRPRSAADAALQARYLRNDLLAGPGARAARPRLSSSRAPAATGLIAPAAVTVSVAGGSRRRRRSAVMAALSVALAGALGLGLAATTGGASGPPQAVSHSATRLASQSPVADADAGVGRDGGQDAIRQSPAGSHSASKRARRQPHGAKAQPGRHAHA